MLNRGVVDVLVRHEAQAVRVQRDAQHALGSQRAFHLLRGAGGLHIDHVRLHGAQVDRKAGQFGDGFGEAFGAGVVFGEIAQPRAPAAPPRALAGGSRSGLRRTHRRRVRRLPSRGAFRASAGSRCRNAGLHAYATKAIRANWVDSCLHFPTERSGQPPWGVAFCTER